jgi:hypothetical protein
MASKDGKKSTSGVKNADRRNGKKFNKSAQKLDERGRPLTGRGKPSGHSAKGMSVKKVAARKKAAQAVDEIRRIAAQRGVWPDLRLRRRPPVGPAVPGLSWLMAALEFPSEREITNLPKFVDAACPGVPHRGHTDHTEALGLECREITNPKRQGKGAS